MTPALRTPDFNRIAPLYRWLEYLTLGPALSRTRSCYLSRLPLCTHALILGDGDGRFTASLLDRQPQLTADVVDASSEMLRLLAVRAERAHPTARARIQLHLADARTQPYPGPYDLVVTHFFLDCLTGLQIHELLDRIVPALAPGAVWILSEFRVPPGILRLPSRMLIRSLYFAFRLLTGLRIKRLPDYAAALRAHGLRTLSTRTSVFGLLTSELWSLAPSDPHPNALHGCSIVNRT